MARSLWLSIERLFQPASLKAPPNPSQVCAVELSVTVTVAFPPVTVVKAAVFQKAPDAEVTALDWAATDPPAPVVPAAPVAPPAPVVPPAPALPPAPVVPAAPLVPLVPAVPVLELSTQTLAAQCCVDPQALPQLALLEVMSTQLPLHIVCPVAQPQAPPLQTCPAAQVMPQAPQFSASAP